MGSKLTVDIDMDERDAEVYGIGGQTGDIVDEDDPVAAPLTIDHDAGEIVDEDTDPADRLPKNARKNADGSVTVTLQFPRKVISKKDGKVREREFSEIVMHRLNGADQRAIAGVSEDLMPVISFARATRLPQAVMNALFDKLDMADIAAMGQVINHFLGSGQKTGR